MNIKYATSEAQNIKVFKRHSIDEIFEKFTDVLGKDVLILDIKDIDNDKEIEVKSIDYGRNYFIEINKLRDQGSIDKYQITIFNEQKSYYVRYLYQYNWHGYSILKEDENYVDEDVLVRKKSFNIRIGYINYIVFKDDKTLYLTLPVENEQVINFLLEIKNIEVKEVYDLLRVIDNNLVLNLSIKVINKNNKLKECISIKDGNIDFYNKEYIENGILIILEYKDNEVIVTKVNICEDIKLDINNLENELEKVKKKTLN